MAFFVAGVIDLLAFWVALARSRRRARV